MNKFANCLFTMICLLISAHALGQDTAIIAHQVYGYKDGMAMYYDVEAPLEPNGKGIVLIVSGGFVSGADNLNITRPFWKVLLDEGYTLFQLYHPAHPTYRIPTAYEALQSGIEHIKTNSLKFGVDRNRLGLFGVSSGGFWSLLLSLSVDPEQRDYSDISAVVAMMPLIDIHDPAFDSSLFGARFLDFDPSLYDEVSPVNYVSQDDPPVLLVHGNRDEAVDFQRNSVRMKNLLDEAGVENSLLEIDAGHEVFSEPYLSETHEAIIEWYKKHLF